MIKFNNGGRFDLEDCLFASCMRRNLLSVAYLEKKGFIFVFSNGCFLMLKVNKTLLNGFILNSILDH